MSLAINDRKITKGITINEEAKAIVEKDASRCSTNPGFNAAKELIIDPEATDFAVDDY